jgi:type I restriction enzyme S subunit
VIGMATQWPLTKLGDIISLEYGKPLPKEDRDPEGAFPVYGANGEKARSNKYYHSNPTIIVGRKGSAGELNLTKGKFWPLDVTYFVTFDEEKYEMKFLYYLLQTLNLPSMAKGVKPGINRNDVYALEVRIPPKEEQQRIVNILDEAFKEINGNIKSTESSLNDYPEIFQSRLHEIYNKGGLDWSDYTLEEVSLDFGRGNSKHRPRNYKPLYGGPYPFIQTGDVRSSNHFISEYTQTYSEMGLAQSKLWPKGTVCITIAANIAETAILDFDACFPDSVIGVVVNPEITTNEYLEYALQFFKTKLQKEGKGSAQDNINMGTFKELKFPFAPLSEQKKIVDLLNILSEQTMLSIKSQQKKIQNLEELKQSILQEAFNGNL